MAERPVFIPNFESKKYVKEEMVDFVWVSGFSKIQRQKCIRSFHKEINSKGIKPVLEISTKSESEIGRALSAFNLFITTKDLKKISVEAAFQTSKVFENGGPYVDMLFWEPKKIKKDERLYKSGKLIKFKYFGDIWNLLPKTAFYDWLYISALMEDLVLAKKLLNYEGFTDIVFNPKKSINCQARSAALFVSLYKQKLLKNKDFSKEKFLKIIELNNSGNEKCIKQQNLFNW